MPRNLKSLVLFLAAFFSLITPVMAATTQLEPIVVKRSAGYDSGGGEDYGSVVLTKEEIGKIPANSPEGLLNYLHVDVQTRAPYGIKSDISLNASTFQQVLILVNGARVKDSQTSHHDLDLFFNVEDIERIEVIPAASCAKYGPDGIGGAINFILKKPGKEKNSISASGGNNETFEEKLNVSYGLLKSRNRFSISNARSNGSRYDTDYRTNTFFHSTALESEDASLYLDMGYNEKEFGAYDFYTPGRGYPSKEWINTKFFDARGVLKKDTFVFEPRINFRQHFDKFMLDITRPSLLLNHHRTDTYLAGGHLSFPFEKGDFGIGADYGEDRIASNNLGKHNRGHWDLYIDPTFKLDPSTSLGLAFRVDDYTTFNEEPTGSISLKHIFDDNSDVHVSFGRTIRVPTFTELYYSDPTTAGDPDLKAEEALNLEAGWSKPLKDNLNFSFSFFVRQEYDTIDFTKLASSDARFIARNISEATTCGLNTLLKWRPTERISVDLSYFYANKRLKDNGKIYKYGLNFLKHMVDLGIDNELPFGHNRVDFIVKKKPTRQEWVLVNDRLTFRAAKALEVFFEVYNLCNVDYQEIEGIPEQGRLFKVGAKLSW